MKRVFAIFVFVGFSSVVFAKGLYLGLGSGYSINPETKFTEKVAPDKLTIPSNVPINFNLGYNISDMLRTDLQVSYGFPVDITVDFSEGADGQEVKTEVFSPWSQLSFIMNIYLQFKFSFLLPYLGAGAGVAFNMAGKSTVKLSEEGKTTDITENADAKTKTAFTWQLSVGTFYFINSQFAFNINYALRSPGGVVLGIDLGADGDVTNDEMILSHDLLLGIRYIL